jgi:multidrug efflux pump
VSSDAQNSGLQELIAYDRPTAARLGITPQSLDQSLYGAFGQSQVSIIYTQLNQYYVVLEVAPPYWQSPDGLKNIYLKTTGSGIVPLSSVSSVQASTTPLIINHTSSFPSVTVSFNLATNMSLSDATRMVSQMQERLNMPPTVRGFFAGTASAYQTSLSSEPLLIGTALLAVYIVLGILYESLVHPLTIISTLPSASVGAMLALMLFKIDLSVISIIGINLLIGIVKKNAIMMIDFALVAEREHGKTTTEAIFEACQLRFRPILMTTMAALFGALPLAFGTGTGSELRRPLGVTIVGGLIVSQMLTLYTTPVSLRPSTMAQRSPLNAGYLGSFRYEEIDCTISETICGVARTPCRCVLRDAGWMQCRTKVSSAHNDRASGLQGVSRAVQRS